MTKDWTKDEQASIRAAKLAEALTDDEAQPLHDALGVYSSDYNEAPHDRIAALRERLEQIGARR